MTNTAWAEIVGRSYDPNDLRKNGEFLSVITKALGAGVVPTVAETQRITKSETLGFSKGDVERLASLLDAALSKGGHVIEGTAYSQFPALHACWNAAPYDPRTTDEPITKAWVEMDVAKRKRLASLVPSPEAVTKMFGRSDAMGTPRRMPVGFTAKATVYRAINRAAPPSMRTFLSSLLLRRASGAW